MLAFVLKEGPPQRIACTNEATYTFLWPSFFTSAVPGARPLCRWAARRGAAVHGGLRLVQRGQSGRCAIVASRALRPGTPLVSLPLTASLSVGGAEDRKTGTFAGRWDPLEELTGAIARHLHNPRSQHRRYLEFLHDLYNTDADDDFEAGDNLLLRSRVDALYSGNAMHVRGADNAPFLDKATLESPSQRVEWIRTEALVRRVEQSLPHFAAKSAKWGASMALARAFPDDNEGLSLYPIIDFCGHSSTPNAGLRVCGTPGANRRSGVKWHDHAVPCAHLVAQRPIAKGDEVTRLFSSRPVASREDAEFWQMRWGFVPEGGQAARGHFTK